MSASAGALCERFGGRALRVFAREGLVSVLAGVRVVRFGRRCLDVAWHAAALHATASASRKKRFLLFLLIGLRAAVHSCHCSYEWLPFLVLPPPLSALFGSSTVSVAELPLP